MQKARRPHYRSDRLQTYGFRVFSLRFLRFFSPFPHGTCSLSVSQEYLALPDGAGTFRQNFSGSALLEITPIYISFTGLSPSMVILSRIFYYIYKRFRANPRSLATTCGITIVFFSSGYLDVSVLRVCLLTDTMSSTQWVAPFGNLRVKAHLQLFATYRSLSRPSSPLRAQASPIRSCLLPTLYTQVLSKVSLIIAL